MRQLLACAVACLFSAGITSAANAAPVTVTFEDAVGTYTPTPGSTQDVKNEFASLGFIFEDISDPSQGATLGKCGPGNGAVSLFGFGNDFAGCGDTTPDLRIIFVDPADGTSPAYTTSVSLLNTDGLIEMSAFDIFGNLLGSVSNSSGILSLSGIGQIAMLTIISLDQDPTTLDDLTFEMVTPFDGSEIPGPAAFVLFGTGMAAFNLMRRRKKRA